MIDYYTRDFSSFQYHLFTTKKIIIFGFFIFRDSLFTVSQSITFVNSAFICMEFGFVILLPLESSNVGLLSRVVSSAYTMGVNVSLAMARSLIYIKKYMMAKSIPGMLGRMASGPRFVSWMHTTAHWSRCLRSAVSCSFAADSHSTLNDMIVTAGPEKGPFV